VVDFGIARRVDAAGGEVSGTPGYISPEQLNGSRPDRRSDIFSFGAVLYEMLSGRHPFAGRSDAETLFNTVAKEPQILEDEPRADLCALVSRALRKEPAERYQTVEEVIADLDSSRSGGRNAGSNPLLSELPAFVRRWSDHHSSGFAIAAGSFVWGCISLGLSVVCGAACVRVLWVPAAGISQSEMIYGYAIEANAGPLYLVGASLFFLAGFGFLHAAHRGLARTTTLTVVTGSGAGSPAALERVADRNRHYFRYLTPMIGIFAVGFVLIPEVVFRENHAFGWVQADLAAQYVSTTYDSLRRAGKIGDLPLVTNLCNECPVRVAAVYNNSGGFRPPSRLLFDVFLVSALGHQIVLTSFLLWIGLKILFFFGLLSTALLSDDKAGLRLVPDLQDKDDYRFGLGRLDNVYYALLLIGAVASLARFLQISANVSKGTYFFAGDPAPALVGQPVVVFAVLVLLAVLVLTPVGVFLFLTVRAVDEELARLAAARKNLEEQRLAARSREDRDRIQFDIDMLRERRETAKKQSLLPIRQPVFIGLLAANLVILLILPKSIGWFGEAAPGRGDTVWHAISDSVCAACGNAPRFTPPEP
jgi:hypothetical protein